MKKPILVLVIIGFLGIGLSKTQGLMTQPKIDQLRSIQVFVGTWDHNKSKDTLERWEVKQHNNAFVTSMHRIIGSKKSFVCAENWGYSARDDKFKGFILYPNGDYLTWIGSFTSEKMFSGELVKDFNPESVLQKFYLKIENPKSFSSVFVTKDGASLGESKWVKIK